MKKITQFADKLTNLIRRVEIKTDNNIEAQFFSAMIDLLLLVEQKEREKLKEYEYLKEQGLLLKLPAKVGDTVYTNTRVAGRYMREKDGPYEAKVVFVGINGVDNFMDIILEKGSMFRFNFSDLGKTVFLTREEAEAALRKNKECNQNG